MFDEQSKALTKYFGVGKGCKFEHKILSKPAQKRELKDLVRVASGINIIGGPERLRFRGHVG